MIKKDPYQIALDITKQKACIENAPAETCPHRNGIGADSWVLSHSDV